MEKKNKIEEMLDQISQVLDFLDANSTKLINSDQVTPELLDRVAKLEKEVEKFTALGEKVIELSHITQETVERGMQELAEFAEITQEAQKLLGTPDPNSLESKAKRQEAEKKMDELVKAAAPNFTKVLEKANEVHDRANDMLLSIDPKAQIQESTFSEEPAHTVEDDEKENLAMQRRRRRLRKIGPDRV